MKSKSNTPKLYIKRLSLRNFATFESQEIEFDRNFNCIVGETGSGKSLILDALMIILGSKAEKKFIRKNEDYAQLEVTIESQSPYVTGFFKKMGYPFKDEIHIKRLIYSNGRSKSYLNFSACNITTIQELALHFFDFVGQFENQKLLRPDYQLFLIDSFGNNQAQRNEYLETYHAYKTVIKDLEKLVKDSEHTLYKQDLIGHHLKEIQDFAPTKEDEEELIQKKKEYFFFEKTQKNMEELNYLITSDLNENNVLQQMNRVKSLVQKNHLQELIPEIDVKVDTCYGLLHEISYEIDKKSQLSIVEEDKNAIIDRLDQYQKLKKKHHMSESDFAPVLEKLQAEFDYFAQLDEKLVILEKKKEILFQKLNSLAAVLHENRIVDSKKISEQLTKIIHGLNMDEARVTIECLRKEGLDKDGFSKINFLIETNPGEGPQPLKAVVSGGELSRVLLGLRQILASNDSISVFFFDEIDAGIGGMTALKIGEALRMVSQGSQVMAITHLPQMAQYAEKLIVVAKKHLQDGDQKRTISYVKEVAGVSKKGELERMMPLA